MAKSKTVYICQSCGTKHAKWQGQCTGCGEWNSLVEEIVEEKKTQKKAGIVLSDAQLHKIITTRSEVGAVKGSKQRFSSKIEELDRVLGGGIVPGAVMLVGGEPGIGKSTLLTQMCLILLGKDEVVEHKNNIESSKDKKSFTRGNQEILYVCGEESPEQINLRINRILNNEQFLDANGISSHIKKNQKNHFGKIDQNLQFVTSTDVDQVAAVIKTIKPNVVIVDSIQTMTTQDLSGASGSIGQVRESTERLISVAKSFSIPIFLVGHVTKDGAIAGPKVLEHMVDAVLQLEGERTGQFRLLRALKNRFGATDEVGVFRVVDYGYQEVLNPSELFIESDSGSVPGSAISCVMEGTRPLLIEVQSLVTSSQLAMPRRVGRGVELSRIQVLAAVLQKHCRLPLGSHDIFLSAAGGFKINEPAVDLALAVAIASSLSNKPVASKAIFIGEVGLLGEIRQVSSLERRIKEAKRLGYKQIYSSQTHRRLDDVLRELKLKK